MVGYVVFLFSVGVLLIFLMGPGEIIYYSINGSWHPSIHYHTIYDEWIKLWMSLGLLMIPALILHYFLDAFNSDKVDEK